MKKELLSPAGDFETLKQAIHNGCDAVYLGGKKFGARKFASNFDQEEMIKAIRYCHLYGVKIYVTVNTMIYESEMDEVIEYIRFLHKNKVDAIIMQDIGLITLVRNIFPNLEIHASTQLHTHNNHQVKLLEKLGIKRVVVAREMSIEEINQLDTNLEIEAFVHGALCVCYSGQCLFSSLLLNRSGNRGECAGICRLPFELYENDKKIKTEGKYLLSPKELNTLNHIKELMESNITSFKIEGRMKSPTTIGFITRLYRMMIDKYENHEELVISNQELEQLKLLFNRGFTDGYLFHQYGKNLMNIKSPNHIGIEIGKVIAVNKDKIQIKLDKPLSQEDGIRFLESDKGMIVNFMYNRKGLLISKANENDIIEVDNKIGLKEKDTVVKTVDHNLMLELEKYKEKKIPIKMHANITIDQGFMLEVSDGIHTLKKTKDIVSLALNNPTAEERVKEQLEKLGNTPFKVKEISIQIPNNVFIPIKEINELRRKIINDLVEIREESGVEFKELENTIGNISINPTDKININVLVRNEEQLKVCIEEKVDTIYVTDKDLYDKYRYLDNVYLRLERVNPKRISYDNERLLVTETGSLEYAKNNDVFTDYYLNVGNHYFTQYLLNNHVKRITLSPEISIEEMKNLKNNLCSLSLCEVIVYGRLEVMVMKYCPLNMLVNDSKYPCGICRNGKNYYLKDRNQENYPLVHTDEVTHILNYKNIEIKNIENYRNLGIGNYRIELWDEDELEARKVIKKVKNLLP